jgi:iron complex transport system substrate-binding protein
VVSLAPSLTDVVLAIGGADVLVGVDRYSAELPGMPPVRVLGDLFSPDLEGVIEVAPTLVIGVDSLAHSGLFGWVRARGIRVETFRLHSLAEVLAAFERVGALLERQDQARTLVRTVREDLDAIAASVRDRRRPRVTIVVQRDPLVVVGGGSFASDLLEIAGGENVFGDLPDAYPRVSLEALAARAPDVLLQTTAPGEAARESVVAYWSARPFIGRAEVIPRGEVVLPGARLADAARILRSAVHSELAPSATGGVERGTLGIHLRAAPATPRPAESPSAGRLAPPSAGS